MLLNVLVGKASGGDGGSMEASSTLNQVKIADARIASRKYVVFPWRKGRYEPVVVVSQEAPVR